MSDLSRLLDALWSIWDELPTLVEDWPELEREIDALVQASRSGNAAESAVAAELRAALASRQAAYARLIDAEASAGEPTRGPAEEVHGVTRGQGSELPEAPPPEEVPPRFVNVALLSGEDFSLLPGARPVVRDREYLVRVDIGELSEESVVVNPTDVPTELLPGDDGHWLELAAASATFVVPERTFPLFLPSAGSSFVCTCTPGTQHRCREEERERFVEIPVRAPSETGRAAIRLGLFYGNNVVQSQLLAADVAAQEGDPGAHCSRIDYTLTSELRDLETLEPRTLSAITNEVGGTHTLVINDGAETVLTFHFSEGELLDAMDNVRMTLLGFHIDQRGNSKVNKLDKDNGKSLKDFADDLGTLARLGRRYWFTLFDKVDDRFAATRGGVGTIQIARVENTDFVFPWGAVYDILLDDDPTRHVLCPLVETLAGDGSLTSAAPERCPYEASHAKNTLCPFGFWGFRYDIEQPPSTGGRALPTEIVVGGSRDVVVARSLDLDARATDDHLRAVESALGDFTAVSCSSVKEVEDALRDPELEVLYFFCHGRRGERETGDGIAYLEVGRAEQITPMQIGTWYVDDWMNAAGHWETTSPLVIINGCHTAELTPQTPVSFVDSFARARAAGVVGTEITLHQTFASEAAQVFLAHFGGSERLSVGESLRRMRLHFLEKGNLLGLAYTAYCSLRLRLTG